MVHIEADERDELVRHVRGERSDEHQHHTCDGITDRRQIKLNRSRHLGDRDEEDHHQHELRQDQRDHERRPFPEPPLGRIPREPRESDRGEYDRDQEEGFADQEGEPHDRSRTDGEAGEEDRDDRPDTGGGDVDPREPRREQGDAVADGFHRVPRGLHDPDRELIRDLQQQPGEADGDERAEDAFRGSEGGAGEGGGVAVDEAGDQLQAEEDQHHEHRDPEEDVVDPDVAFVGDVDEGGGVEHRPDRLEQPRRRPAHCLGEPVERGRDQRRCSLPDGVAHGRDHRHITHTHRILLPSYAMGLDGLADAPEEVDERHRRAADDRRPAGHEHADLPARSEMRVAAVRAEAPHDRGDDQGEDGEDQADGHHRADDDAQLLDTGKPGTVRVNINHRDAPSAHKRQGMANLPARCTRAPIAHLGAHLK